VETLRERALPWVSALLAVIGSIGWLNAQLASLDRGDKDRDKIREVAVNARDREISELKADIRELRASQSNCRGQREHE
jgi:hypothetical protein